MSGEGKREKETTTRREEGEDWYTISRAYTFSLFLCFREKEEEEVTRPDRTTREGEYEVVVEEKKQQQREEKKVHNPPPGWRVSGSSTERRGRYTTLSI